MDLLKVKADTEDPVRSDFTNLATVFIGSFLYFWLCYFVSAAFMKHFCAGNKKYQALTPGKKADYISRIVANIHAVLSCIAAILSFYYTWYDFL